MCGKTRKTQIMENKKQKKLSLENKRFLLFISGFIVALSCILMAFEWRTSSINEVVYYTEFFGEEVEYMETLPAIPKPNQEVKKLEKSNEIKVVNELVEPNMDRLNNDLDFDDILTLNDTFAIGDPGEIAEPGPQIKKPEKIHDWVDVYANYDCENIQMFLKRNLKYPELARQERVSGQVVVEFIVDKKGKVSKPKILKSLGFGCDEEVIRVVNKMDCWQPGMIKGKKVSSYLRLPVNFTFSN